MKYHSLQASIKNDIVCSFAETISNSTCNPIGPKGINLHFEKGEEIPHQDSITVIELISGTMKKHGVVLHITVIVYRLQKKTEKIRGEVMD